MYMCDKWVVKVMIEASDNKGYQRDHHILPVYHAVHAHNYQQVLLRHLDLQYYYTGAFMTHTRQEACWNRGRASIP